MEASQRNLKRKRRTMEDSTGGDPKFTGKLHHGLKEVKKAAKKAKIFETQRLIKKLKSLRKNEAAHSDIAEHEAQLDIIKTIDHEILANIAAKSKFAKDHLLSRHDSIIETLSQDVGKKVLSIAPQDTTVGKAYNRLLSSKILAAEVSLLCRALHQLLDPDAKNITENGTLNIREETKDVMSGETKSPELIAFSDSDSDSHLPVNKVTRWESGMETDDHFDITEELPSSSQGDSRYPQIENMEDNDHPVVNKSVESATKPSAVESTFLPSLSVGFVRGSDESDWSGNEAPVADPGKRKNRRGQRARRAIWEKKFGRNANHKKKEFEALPKRQAHEQNRKVHRKPDQWPGKRGDIFGGSTTSNSVPRSEDSHQQTKKHEERPLHPSWAAKRQMKEKQTLGIVPSLGTKIKFSD